MEPKIGKSYNSEMSEYLKTQTSELTSKLWRQELG
jgi:hypothetical protein